MSSLLSTQLSRHPSLRAVDREVVWAKHPGVTDARTGHKVVPTALLTDNTASVFLNPEKNAYGDRILADGRTIEFHPSTSAKVNADLYRLVGREATLYAYLGRAGYRTGRIRVERPPTMNDDGVLYLRIQPPELPVAMPRGTAWADMSDD